MSKIIFFDISAYTIIHGITLRIFNPFLQVLVSELVRVIRAREISVDFLDRFLPAFKVLKLRIILAHAEDFKRIKNDGDDFFGLGSSVADEEENCPA